MSYLLLDYACPCGKVTESLEDRAAPSKSLVCACGRRAVRALSASHLGTVWAQVERGSSTERASPGVLDTRPLADGMSHYEWKQKRRAYRAAERRKEIRREFG